MLIQCVTHVEGRDKKVVKALITSLYTTLSEDGMRVEKISDLLLLSSKANFKKNAWHKIECLYVLFSGDHISPLPLSAGTPKKKVT